MKKCMIIANGKSPAKRVVKFFYYKGFNTIICADGGANYAKRIGINPDFIIGDLDSANPETIKYFSDKSKIIKIKRQNDTDVEKCLKFAKKKGYSQALLLGVTGDRLDHTICNLGIVIKYYQQMNISVVAEKSFLLASDHNIDLKSYIGETISLYAFNDKTKINSTGLKYKLVNTTLPFGKKESTSNAASSDLIKIKVSGGIVFVVRDFNFMRKHDLFQFN